MLILRGELEQAKRQIRKGGGSSVMVFSLGNTCRGNEASVTIDRIDRKNENINFQMLYDMKNLCV